MSKKNNPKIKEPISELIESENIDEDENWLKLEVNNKQNSENEYIKVLSATIDLNEYDFPRLFELNEDNIPEILKKIITFGYNSYFPEPIVNIIDEDTIIETHSDQKLDKKIDMLDTLINKLTGVSNNSKKIGIFGENYIQELIAKNFIVFIVFNF